MYWNVNDRSATNDYCLEEYEYILHIHVGKVPLYFLGLSMPDSRPSDRRPRKEHQ